MATTILHFIVNLRRGGAETMLAKSINDIKEYNHVIVTLEPGNDFETELKAIPVICLHRPSMWQIPTAVIKLRQAIHRHRVNMVHSHLPLCHFIARLAVPAHVPLLSTIHTSVKHVKDYNKWYIRALDKYTFAFRKSTLIAVSRTALDEYFAVLKIDPRPAIVLHSFIDPTEFTINAETYAGGEFRIVHTGSLRHPKNQAFLINAFRSLKGKNCVLHIYGEGPLRNKLQQQIQKNEVAVTLKGHANSINYLLPRYHLFTMSSVTEGFSVSVLEAMAAKLPLLLSDIHPFREQCGDAALYFDANNEQDFCNKVLQLKSDETLRNHLAEQAHKRVLQQYTREQFLRQLKTIYASAAGGM